MSDSLDFNNQYKYIRRLFVLVGLMTFVMIPLWAGFCHAESFELEEIISEALRSSPDLAAMNARSDSSAHKIPQARSLPDPMFMVGYQNMGTRAYTYGEKDSQWMFTASQMFPYPGKLSLKAEMAEKESQSLEFETELAGINIIQRIRETYQDLAFAHKELEIINAKKILFGKIEETSLARYSSGMGMQQDVLMAQTEKYMIMENEEMIRSGIASMEAMLTGVMGRHETLRIRKPVFKPVSTFNLTIDQALKKADEGFPEIHARIKMAEASRFRADMAEKEYYPDFTISAGYGMKGADNEDMVNFSATANIPLFYRTKQREGVLETQKTLEQSRHAVEAARLMTAAKVRDNYAMLESSGNLAKLYNNAVIPRNRLDFDQALAGFSAGRTEAAKAIEKLKTLMDSETAYWRNMAEREKAVARIEALAGIAVPAKYVGKANAGK